MDMESQIDNLKKNSHIGKTLDKIKEQFTNKKDNLESINQRVEHIFSQNDEIMNKIKEIDFSRKTNDAITMLLENKVKLFIEEVFKKHNEIKLANEKLHNYLNFLNVYDENLSTIRESKRLQFDQKNFEGKVFL
jgi:hypothetical protein